ncbi:hypothetical protein M011DRAFT_495334 [Sporormia fimetaria CBS 119925]|uniref:Uncharacterized protein n=1 Tax=Sporormia fimetaria CBS 119925 TaxID=1340428 RepID=A0A6A6V5R0_9PLEO|nr:hypothetical protein M011DRAFT_495334 [Sporormia fimetaria CBS 119925]
MPRIQSKSKRVAAGSGKRPATEKVTPTRQSKRVKATLTKSPYFEPESDEDAVNQDIESSDYEEAAAKSQSSESEAGEQTSDDATPRKTAILKGRSSKRTPLSKKKQTKGSEVWETGAKLAPGTQVVIKKPKARDEGDTPYTDDTIHPNTMHFLRDLAANNDRKWLKMHDPDYRVALKDFNTFLESLTERICEVDDTIPELPVKDITFRIYRDVRFSKDQTPYKTHFSAAWSRTGRKGPYAAYYVQVKPDGGSFVGGGLWCPEAQALSALRHDIDQKPHRLKAVLRNARIRKDFLGGIADDERMAVRSFTNLSENKSTALKKHPKGYDKEHVDIELLRLKNFTLGTKLSDEDIVGAGGLERITELVASMVPFIRYLNSVVMPDDEDEESTGSSDSGSADERADENSEGSAA